MLIYSIKYRRNFVFCFFFRQVFSAWFYLLSTQVEVSTSAWHEAQFLLNSHKVLFFYSRGQKRNFYFSLIFVIISLGNNAYIETMF